MPGLLVTIQSQVTCTHQGKATTTVPNLRVRVMQQATVLLSSPYTVAGCVFPPPPSGNGPCVTGSWAMGTTRVKSNNLPLVIQGGQGTCAPTGTPLLVAVTQSRVFAM